MLSVKYIILRFNNVSHVDVVYQNTFLFFKERKKRYLKIVVPKDTAFENELLLIDEE